MWLAEENFEALVINWWNNFNIVGDAAKVMVGKLRALRKELKKWNKDCFGNLDTKKKLLQEDLLHWEVVEEERLLTDDEKSKKNFLATEWNKVVDQEEIMWRQRSRVKWLKEGDLNTSFFHKIANGRKRNNTISSLIIDGVENNEPEDIIKEFTKAYKKIFGEKIGNRIEVDWGLLYTNEEWGATDIDSQFTEEEIWTAIKEMSSDAAPGPDGYPMLFFQKFWFLIKNEVMNLFSELYEGNLNLSRLNYSHIVLIPKVEGANKISEFRPICLLNCIYKIITKVLANRLKTKLDVLIGPSQTAFIMGRNIVEGVIAVQEVISHCFKNNEKGIMLKLDFMKAYDMLDWDFLISVMQARGFSSRWISWIKSSLVNGTTSLLINGSPGPLIVSRRGLRQGDPLSPLLFVLATDVFYRIINRAVSISLLSSLGNNVIPGGIASLQYADDTIIFCSPNPSHIMILKTILYGYELLSGLRINFHKSAAYLLGEDDCLLNQVASAFNCKVGTFPITYLGLPLRPGKLLKEDWQPLIDKFDKRLSSWKSSTLSRGGRLVLVNSVLSAIPTYWMSFYLLPKWLIQRLDTIRKRFFWKGPTRCSPLHCLVAWGVICKSKNQGGLGVIDLGTFNTALLGKWLWKWYSDDKKIWCQWIKHSYFPPNPHLSDCSSHNLSPFWKGVISNKDCFQRCIKFEVGNGVLCQFWLDCWLTNTPLASHFPHLYNVIANKNARVADTYDFVHKVWNFRFLGNVEGDALFEFSAMMKMLESVCLNDENDAVKWCLDPSSKFSTKSFYQFLNDGGIRCSFYKALWSCPVPPKIKVFMWILAKEKLNTLDMLNKKGMFLNTGCSLCSNALESHNHLFLTCSVSTQFWERFLATGNVSHGMFDTILEYWERWRLLVGGNEIRICLDTLVMSIAWHIWKERNHRIFQQQNHSMQSLCYQILTMFMHWLDVYWRRKKLAGMRTGQSSGNVAGLGIETAANIHNFADVASVGRRLAVRSLLDRARSHFT